MVGVEELRREGRSITSPEPGLEVEVVLRRTRIRVGGNDAVESCLSEDNGAEVELRRVGIGLETRLMIGGW